MVFISYSHRDTAWKDRFLTIFKPLKRYVGIEAWSDQRINPGVNGGTR